MQTQRLVAEFMEHSSVLQSFSFNADKTLLITASADNTAKVCARQQCGTLPTVSDCPLPLPLTRRASTLRAGCFGPQYKLDAVGRGRMGRLGDWGLPTVVLASQAVVCVLPSVFRHAFAPCMTHHPHALLCTAMQLWFVPTIMAAAGLAESIPGAPEDPVIKTFVCNTQVNAGAISPLKPHVRAILPRSCVLVWRGNCIHS